MRTENIAVVENAENLRRIADLLNIAADEGRKVRFTVDGGLKVAGGGGMWSAPLGRISDACGQ